MSKFDIQLTPYEDLFETDDSRMEFYKERVHDVPIGDLMEFPDHLFRVLKDDELMKIVTSIKENGVIMPALGREVGNKVELISGHRRKLACEILGIETMPVIVRKMTDDEAVIAMIDSNLQRENILPSEKAKAYKMKLEALTRKAGRPKNNSSQVATNYRADAEVGKESSESKDQVRRYIRLNNLIPEILTMFDEKRIAFNPAVEISYLTESEQDNLLEVMESEDCTPSLSQSQRLKRLSAEERLDGDVIHAMLSEEKPNQKEQLRIKLEDLRGFFPKSYTTKQIEETILKLVFEWQKHRERNSRDER